MAFELGDIVRDKKTGLEATVIAIDTRARETVVLGWKRDEDRDPGSFSINELRLLRTDEYLPNLREDFHFCVWENIIHFVRIKSRKSFTKVSNRTLRKRMRDQIAQEIFTVKD